MDLYYSTLKSTNRIDQMSAKGLLYLHYCLKCKSFCEDETIYNENNMPSKEETRYIMGLTLEARFDYSVFLLLMDQLLNRMIRKELNI